MRVLLALAATTLLCLTLAGCTGGGNGGEPTPTVDFTDLDLEATETTGVIRGVVVDTAVRPVPDVTIELRGAADPRTTKSNAEGAFGFGALPPGDYFLVANRTGYIEAQSSTQVVAGVAEPPIVKILLEADPTQQPYVQANLMQGFIECSVRPMFVALQCGATDVDVVNVDYDFSGTPRFVQSEMVWESTQAAGDELSLAIRCLPGDGNDPAGKCPDGQLTVVRSEGKSPQVARINQTLIETWALGENPLHISLFAFGRSDLDVYDEGTVDPAQKPVTGKDCLEWQDQGLLFGPGTCMRLTGPGLIVNQRVDVYTHVFYGYAPPVEWQFSLDGDPPSPL